MAPRVLPRARPLDVPGRISPVYRVRDVAEVDAALRQLATWQELRPGALTSAVMENVRHDQDVLLDARTELAKKGW